MTKPAKKEKELPGMPGYDQTGKWAAEFLDLGEEIAQLQEKRQHAAAELISMLKAQKKSEIKIRGIRLGIKEIAARAVIARLKDGE